MKAALILSLLQYHFHLVASVITNKYYNYIVPSPTLDCLAGNGFHVYSELECVTECEKLVNSHAVQGFFHSPAAGQCHCPSHVRSGGDLSDYLEASLFTDTVYGEPGK